MKPQKSSRNRLSPENFKVGYIQRLKNMSQISMLQYNSFLDALVQEIQVLYAFKSLLERLESISKQENLQISRAGKSVVIDFFHRTGGNDFTPVRKKSDAIFLEIEYKMSLKFSIFPPNYTQF